MCVNSNQMAKHKEELGGDYDQPSVLTDMFGRLELPDVMRRRSLSDSAKVREKIITKNVPQITVEDCSEQQSSDDDFFNVPSRPRARTCPEDMFRLPKVRPPTPPPEEEKQFKPVSKHRSRERLIFAHHKLERVAEETRDGRADSAKGSKKLSQKSSGKDKMKSHSPTKEISLLSKNKRTLISRPIGLTECG